MTEASSVRTIAPIFVVGAPRSGTSILTWCLGQHSNIIPQEESGWIAPLATDLAARYLIGTMHGERSQLSALGVNRDQFLELFGNTIDALVHTHRASQERICHSSAVENPCQLDPSFLLTRSGRDTKSRWVDGTPEYSTQVYALKKLFPHAKFVHIVRDAHDVVQSMLHFKLSGKIGLVETEEEAYAYWYKMVQASLNAEAALGSDQVHRLRYADLVGQPIPTMRRILDFLGEPFDPACIEPLSRKINSSCVPQCSKPSTFKSNSPAVEVALKLNERLQSDIDALSLTPYSVTQLENEFEHRVQYAAQGLAEDYKDQCAKVRALTIRLNWLCAVLLIYVVAAFWGVISDNQRHGSIELADLACLVAGVAGSAFYFYLRRAGLKAAFRRATTRIFSHSSST